MDYTKVSHPPQNILLQDLTTDIPGLRMSCCVQNQLLKGIYTYLYLYP